MNKCGKMVLVIGNGFDLAHVLSTRYTDFLEFNIREKRIFAFDFKSKAIEYKELILIIGR